MADRAAQAEARAPASVARALRLPGRPLEPSVRAAAERRHRAPLHDVRLREDAESTAELGAAAYTVGRDVVFAPGRGRRGPRDPLLRHELVHVIQQRNARAAAGPLAVVPPGHATEREADAGAPATELAAVAVQRAPDDGGAADATGGAFTVQLLSTPFELQERLEGELTAGMVAELRAQEANGGRVSKLLARFEDMGILDRAKYGAGVIVGLLWGLVSPVVDLVKMIVSLVEFGAKVNQWLTEQLVGALTGKLGPEISKAVDRVTARLAALHKKLGDLIEGAAKHPLETLRMLGTLADMALRRMLAGARDLGRQVVDRVLEFFELPWWDFGLKVGYAVGWVAIQIVLVVFSEGIGNALSWLAKGVEALGTVGAAIVRVARLVIAAVEKVGEVVKKLISWLIGELRAAAVELGAVFEELGRLFEEILPSAERLETAGAPGGGSVLMSKAEQDAGAIAPRDPQWIKDARPAKVHPANVGKEAGLESRAAGEGGGARSGRAAAQTRSVVDAETAELRRRFPKLDQANLRKIPSDVSQPGRYEQRMFTGTKGEFEADWAERKSGKIRLDGIDDDGRLIDSKVRDSGRQYGPKESYADEPTEPDVYEQMTGEGRRRSRPFDERLPEKDEQELAEQVRFAQQHGLTGVQWITTSARYRRLLEQVIDERGWRGFVTVIDALAP